MEYFKGKLRNEAFEKLKVFLINPGRFCLLLIGNRGTGKIFAIEKAFEYCKNFNEIKQKELCLNDIIYIKSNEVTDYDGLENIFNSNIGNTVVFEDVENLKENIQELLFKALETTDGRLGLNEKVDIRIVFTSSQSIEMLRTDTGMLRGTLWDRISQLLIEFPGFDKENTFIVTDFRNVWNKMNFDNIKGFEHFSHYPNNTKLQAFLQNSASKFSGGFRDLDKIAILFFNYRILYYKNSKKIIEETENIIVDKIKQDFFGKIQLQINEDQNFNTFIINWDLKWKEILKNFKREIRILWKKKNTNSSYTKLEEKLGLSKGTTKNWK